MDRKRASYHLTPEQIGASTAVFRPHLSYEAPSVAASERIPAEDDPCNLDGAVPVPKAAHPLLKEIAHYAHEEVATKVNEAK